MGSPNGEPGVVWIAVVPGIGGGLNICTAGGDAAPSTGAGSTTSSFTKLLRWSSPSRVAAWLENDDGFSLSSLPTPITLVRPLSNASIKPPRGIFGSQLLSPLVDGSAALPLL